MENGGTIKLGRRGVPKRSRRFYTCSDFEPLMKWLRPSELAPPPERRTAQDRLHPEFNLGGIERRDLGGRELR